MHGTPTGRPDYGVRCGVPATTRRFGDIWSLKTAFPRIWNGVFWEWCHTGMALADSRGRRGRIDPRPLGPASAGHASQTLWYIHVRSQWSREGRWSPRLQHYDDLLTGGVQWTWVALARVNWRSRSTTAACQTPSDQSTRDSSSWRSHREKPGRTSYRSPSTENSANVRAASIHAPVPSYTYSRSYSVCLTLSSCRTKSTKQLLEQALY